MIRSTVVERRMTFYIHTLIENKNGQKELKSEVVVLIR